MNFTYYDPVVRGSEREDSLLIIQFLKGMIGETFSFLNYYQEIPVSYDARLVSLEHDMAEFEVHEYQAKVISLEKKVLIRSHTKSPVPEDLVGDAFYVNAGRKKVILSRFGYAKIHADLRRFVRVHLDGQPGRRADVDIHADAEIIPATVSNISLGGVALQIQADPGTLEPGKEVNLVLKLETPDDLSMREIGVTATVVKVVNTGPTVVCILEFHSERHSQQALAHYINQLQIGIIRELKEMPL